MQNHRTFCIHSLAELDALASWLALRLSPGDVLALDGPMGAGKTTFVQALGRALAVREKVVSPTYTLIHEYQGTLPLVHADLYRLGPEGAEGLAPELMASLDEGRSVIVVEWAGYGDFLAPITTLSLCFKPVPNETLTDETRMIEATSRNIDLSEAPDAPTCA